MSLFHGPSFWAESLYRTEQNRTEQNRIEQKHKRSAVAYHPLPCALRGRHDLRPVKQTLFYSLAKRGLIIDRLVAHPAAGTRS